MLPQAHLAVVVREKVVSYLLNAAHPDNGGKAAFFEMLGYTPLDWQAFASTMRGIAVEGSLSKELISAHGTKYVVDGEIEGPRGRTALVRTVWIVDLGSDRPGSLPLIHTEGAYMKEHDRVVLTTAVPAENLEAGDVGTVVHAYRDGRAYEVEFLTLDGRTAAVVTLEDDQVRPVSAGEITHSRRLTIGS